MFGQITPVLNEGKINKIRESKNKLLESKFLYFSDKHLKNIKGVKSEILIKINLKISWSWTILKINAEI